jgi:SMODS-associated and fused to various effectors sensor domain
MSLASATPPPSASGARLTGDDTQHAIAWYHALRAIQPRADITSVAVEAADAGNVDDIVVRHAAPPDDFLQVKAAVAATRPATTDWLTKHTARGGASILQRFHEFYVQAAADGHTPRLQLITNRSIDPDDPILTLRDRHDSVADRLRRARDSRVVTARVALAAHLGVSEEAACTFLDSVRLRTDASEATWIEHVQDLSLSLGLHATDADARLGIAEVREWVKTSRAKKTPADVNAAIERLGLRIADPWEILVVQALDTEADTDDAAAVLDWVDRFAGYEARTRRGLRNPGEWTTVLADELAVAERALRTTQVLIRGKARLPVWFAVGVRLGRTRGYHVATVQNGELWSTDRTPPPAPALTTSPLRDPVPGEPLALSVAISADPSDDAARHLAAHLSSAGHIRVALAAGVGSHVLAGADHAWSTALAIRDEVRSIALAAQPSILHLFLAAPGGFALLLGHVWDRVPDTQTYEDLKTKGYEAAFLIHN